MKTTTTDFKSPVLYFTGKFLKHTMLIALLLSGYFTAMACDCDAPVTNIGMTESSTSFTFTGTKAYAGACGCYELTVEVKPVGEAFNGSNFFSSNDGCINGAGNQALNPVIISKDDLFALYGALELKWRIRTTTSGGNCYLWVEPNMNFFACTGSPTESITTSGSSLLCAGEPVVLTAPTGTSYQWLKDGQFISGANSATYEPNESGDYSVSVNPQECPTSSVTINPNPVVAITADQTTISAGESTTLTASFQYDVEYLVPLGDLLNVPSSCGNGSMLSNVNQGFQWMDTESATATNVNIQFSVGVECHNGQTHTTSINGNTGPSYTQTPTFCDCSLPTTEAIVNLDIDPADYNSGELNDLIITSSNTSMGFAPAPSLDNNYAKITVTYGDPNISFSWTPGDLITNPIVVSPESETTYSLTAVNDVTGCNTTVPTTINVVPGFSLSATDVSCSGADNGSITVTPVGNSENIMYSLNDGAFVSTNTFADLAPGTYQVKIQDGDYTSPNESIEVGTTLDTTPPTVVTQNISVNLDADGNASITAGQIDNGSSAVCGIQTISVSPDAFACTDLGANSVELTVTDINGNVSSASATVTVNDNIDPVISGMPADISVNNDAASCDAVVSWTAPTASDNCQITSLTPDFNSGDTFPVGTTTVTYTAEDTFGNSVSASFNIVVSDVSDPVISNLPADVAVNNDTESCDAIVSWTAPTASDNCELASLTSNFESGAAFPVGTTTVTYTAEDIYGNTATAAFDVVVSDASDPIISEMPADLAVNNDTESCDAIVSWTAPTASDNCELASLTSNFESGAAFPVGTTTVTYTAEDIYGNTATASFDVVVSDVSDPIISEMPADVAVNNDAESCDAIVSWTAPTASDNCEVASLTSDFESGAAFPVGTTTVTYTAEDIYGNTATASFDIVVSDVSAPVIAGMPANMAVNNDTESCDAIVSWTAPTASDNCELASLTSNFESGAAFPVGTTTVTYTAEDIYGNTATASFDVVVSDATDPIISEMPADVAVNNDTESCDAIVSWTAPTASDNCELASLTSNFESGAAFPVGTTTVTYTAEDIHGNTATASFDVVVSDATDPVISEVPALISVNNDAESCEAIVTWTAPTASDNCEVASLTSDFESGTAFPVGTTTVTYTAEDIHGNTATASFDVVVSDATDPVISEVPALISVNNDAESCEAIVSWTAPTASDNCELASLTSDFESGTAFPVGTTTVTYTAEDIHGNTATASFDVIVQDNEAPVFADCPVDTIICSGAFSFENPVATDNCEVEVTQSEGPLSGDVLTEGFYTITFTATDLSNNVATCSFEVEVMPLPEVALTDTTVCINHTLELDGGSGFATYLWEVQPADLMFETQTINLEGSEMGSGTHTVSLTVSDENGCVNSASMDVIVDPCTGVDELDQLHSVKVYPNPARDNFNIDINSSSSKVAQLLLMDSNGRMVIDQKVNLSAGDNTHNLNIADLKRGVYYLRVITGNDVINKKIISQ
ncbi:HYR domain-containing protein [Halocola ammonii]